MMELYAKRELDKILRDLNPKSVEERKKMVVVPHSLLSVMERYLELRDNCHYNCSGILEHISSLEHVLSPSAIETFSSLVMEYDDHHFGWIRGQVITQLIQNSYDAGFNNFNLYLIRFPGMRIGYGGNLVGKKDNNIFLTIRDSVDQVGIASSAQHVTIYFESEYKDIFLPGGDNAKNCTFVFYKDMGLVVKHQSSQGVSANCTYKTNMESTLGPLLLGFDKGYGNKIIFIHPDGSEELKGGD